VASDSEHVAAQLHHALASRVQLEQAKGLLAERVDVTMDEALALIRRYAQAHHLEVHDVTSKIIGGTLDVSLLAGPPDLPPGD
jgi:AmiR/NasT family two-component response regulator